MNIKRKDLQLKHLIKKKIVIDIQSKYPEKDIKVFFNSMKFYIKKITVNVMVTHIPAGTVYFKPSIDRLINLSYSKEWLESNGVEYDFLVFKNNKPVNIVSIIANKLEDFLNLKNILFCHKVKNLKLYKHFLIADIHSYNFKLKTTIIRKQVEYNLENLKEEGLNLNILIKKHNTLISKNKKLTKKLYQKWRYSQKAIR